MNNIENHAKKIIEKSNSAESIIIYDKATDYEIDLANDKVFDVRSISKTILSLACGILIEKSGGEFNLDTFIYPIIKDKVKLTNKKNLKYLEKIKVRHLLTHTTGYRDLILYSKDIRKSQYDDLFEYIINYPIYYKPGDHFLYSNAGYYLLAITMQEYLDYEIFHFIEENLLKPLDIYNRSWGKFGKYIAGATKINFNSYDMLKIGNLIFDDGKYNDKQIVSKAYISSMIRAYNENKNEIKRNYISEDLYGYGIWISKNGTIFASGTGGQLIVILKDLDMIIVSTNSGSDSKSHQIKKDIDDLIKYMYESRV
ncbi:serine hydrolase [uncultured Anaerococcus sp.]|uniref:serine hydrolase domain-containing protein n=1 Tax=uncultured Anaerococcus sp. TaxID=293428 RepID=UPI00261FE870|nr:serine hydrolase [uncultured Anaerococcus sp.]